MHSLEQALNNFTKRSAVYDVVFWEGSSAYEAR